MAPQIPTVTTAAATSLLPLTPATAASATSSSDQVTEILGFPTLFPAFWTVIRNDLKCFGPSGGFLGENHLFRPSLSWEDLLFRPSLRHQHRPPTRHTSSSWARFGMPCGNLGEGGRVFVAGKSKQDEGLDKGFDGAGHRRR